MIRSGAVLACCLSGLLAVSACGSGPARPASTPAASRAPGTTAPAAPGSSAESVRIGPYTQVFATPLPANPAQAKVMAGFREAQTLWDKSDYTWHLSAPVKEYVTGQALTHLIAAVTASRAHHLVPAGTERFFMTHVSGITGSTATVTTCDDGSKVTEENRQTGATYTTPPGQAYIFETWRMVKLSGHWAVTAFSLAVPPSARAAPCQP
jgi:hypothetical protein